MKRLKRWFPLLWIGLLLTGAVHASSELLSNGLSYSWLAALMGCCAVIIVLGGIAIGDHARTSENLPLLHTLTASAPALILLDLMGGNEVDTWPLLYSVVFAYGGTLAYLRWYAPFQRSSSTNVQPGAELPEFTLQTISGEKITSQQIINNRPTVLMFIRGNWCPLCVAQVKELASDYRKLANAGAQVAVISSQPSSKTAKLAERFDAPMKFFVDVNNDVAKTLGIFNESGAPAGVEILGYESGTAYPTTLIVNHHGRILYSNQTTNYRVRPEPAEFLQVLEATQPQKPS